MPLFVALVPYLIPVSLTILYYAQTKMFFFSLRNFFFIFVKIFVVLIFEIFFIILRFFVYSCENLFYSFEIFFIVVRHFFGCENFFFTVGRFFFMEVSQVGPYIYRKKKFYKKCPRLVWLACPRTVHANKKFFLKFQKTFLLM